MLGGLKQNFVHTRTQEKGAVTPQETNPDSPMMPRRPQWRCGSAVARFRAGDTECSRACTRPGKKVAVIFPTSTTIWSQVNREGSQPTENCITHLLNLSPPIRTRSSFPHSQSLQEASISLFSLSFRGQTEGKPQSQKTNQTDHMDHSLV